MNRDWHSIWSSRPVHEADASSLEDLLRLDGWDSQASKVCVEDWLDYVDGIASELSIADGESMFEVGCGAGAFLVALTRIRNIQCAGLDYSEALIEVARRALPGTALSVLPADAMPTGDTYDYVIANGVFHYFPLDYAERVLGRMLAGARRGVAVLEVPNARTRAKSEQERARLLGDSYEEKYNGLDHTYFDPDWFIDQACRVPGWSARTAPQFIRNYAQSQFRFNVFIHH